MSAERVTAEVAPGLNLVTFNDNGAWSWFEDERAVITNGKILVGSISNSAGTAARKGYAEVASYTLANGFTHRSVLRTGMQNNDHNSPVLHVRPDGRILTAYSDHDIFRGKYFRVSTNPGDTASWQPEQFVPNAGGVVGYSNLHRLSAENGGAGLTYDFYRDKGLGWDPHYQVSADDGDTWSYGGRLFDGPGRPYVKYASNGTDQIHFITTEQHPDQQNTGIFHGYIEDGKTYRSDGSFVANLSTNTSTNLIPDDFTELFAGSSSRIAWTNDLALDASGNPYAVYSVRVPGDGMRYRYSRWDNGAWVDNQIAFAGTRLQANAADYAGLAALDPDNPDIVYISTDVDPVTGTALISNADAQRHHEIFKGVTDDLGATWVWEPLTQDSTVDNVRPIVPKSDGTNSAVLWLAGEYTTFVEYDLEVIGLINGGTDALPEFIVGDLNFDGSIDLADADRFVQNLHTDLTGLNPQAAYERGDLDGDLNSGYEDLLLFRQAYNNANGPGALAAALVSVPEPSSAAIALLAIALGKLRSRQD